MFDFVNSSNFLFLFTLINFILIYFLFLKWLTKMSVLKKQNAENNMEIHEINKEIMKMNGCICEISNFLNNYPVKENSENKENGNE